MPVLICQDDVESCLCTNPSFEEIDVLTKHELQLVARGLGVLEVSDIVRARIFYQPEASKWGQRNSDKNLKTCIHNTKPLYNLPSHNSSQTVILQHQYPTSPSPYITKVTISVDSGPPIPKPRHGRGVGQRGKDAVVAAAVSGFPQVVSAVG
ncbi:hypothetical protein Pmani_032449 [Petrolisthes manimaculis]|uniref:Uncharacterized protein n=1 Tax=Petrolisthes manimaculis TaxID=1843537 RepID=A0AAE1NT08_9EUCA|nr:hypothetical protein Pmani_032449 [Petrolisthes manimaculis]